MTCCGRRVVANVSPVTSHPARRRPVPPCWAASSARFPTCFAQNVGLVRLTHVSSRWSSPRQVSSLIILGLLLTAIVLTIPSPSKAAPPGDVRQRRRRRHPDPGEGRSARLNRNAVSTSIGLASSPSRKEDILTAMPSWLNHLRLQRHRLADGHHPEHPCSSTSDARPSRAWPVVDGRKINLDDVNAMDATVVATFSSMFSNSRGR